MNPDPLVLLRIPHRKRKGNRTFGSFHLGLGGDTALGVGDLDTESLGLGENVNALAGRDGVGDPIEHINTIVLFHFNPRANVLGSVGAVVHQEELDVLGVVDDEGLVAGGHHVTGLLVATVTDLSPPLVALAIAGSNGSYGGHGGLALEAAADGIVNTLGLAPRGANTLEPVRLVTVEAVGACVMSVRQFILMSKTSRLQVVRGYHRPSTE